MLTSKGDICQRQITSPQRSGKARKNSGKMESPARYQITDTTTHNTKDNNSHGGMITPCTSAPWWWWWQAHAAFRGSRSTHRHGCREMSRHHGGGWWMKRPHRGSA